MKHFFVVLALLALLPATARADRPPTAVLWLPGEDATANGELAQAIDAALAASTATEPLEVPELRALLREGGPESFVAERLAAGRARLASLSAVPEAAALLGEAEEVALAKLPRAVACPYLVEIERLRLRYAELVRDEATARTAARWLGACEAEPTAEEAAAMARHPDEPTSEAGSLRVESDPSGAQVFLDLRPVGQTPLTLPGPRRPGALLDVELDGYRKAHRTAPATGTLEVALARDDGLAALVDAMRARGYAATEVELAKLGRRVGATRLLVVQPSKADPEAARAEPAKTDSAKTEPAKDEPVKTEPAKAESTVSENAGAKPETTVSHEANAESAKTGAVVSATEKPVDAVAATARVLDVGRGAWAEPAVHLNGADVGSLATQLVAYAMTDTAAAAQAAQVVASTGAPNEIDKTKTTEAAKPDGKKPEDKPVPVWKRWYTWVVGGLLVAGIVTVLVVDRVGDDQITVHVAR